MYYQLSLLLLAVTPLVVGAFPDACYVGCRCIVHTVTCHRLLNSSAFTAAMSALPAETEFIKISGSNASDVTEVPMFNDFRALRRLDWSGSNVTALGVFTFSSMWNLEEMTLSDNAIAVFATNQFQSMPKLRYLLLQHAFAAYDPRVFAGAWLADLRVLDLSENRIDELNSTAGFFGCGMAQLAELNLARNRLHALSVPAHCLASVRLLNLSANHIHALGDDDRSTLAGLDATLDLTGNPFVCSCANAEFVRWMQNGTRRSTLARGSMVCGAGSAHALEGADLLAVDVDELGCGAQTQTAVRARSTWNVLGIIAVVGVSVLILSLLVYTYRWRIANATLTALSPMRKKHYRKLELVDEERAREVVEFEV
ncbi:PREDICTED: toll-like receptor 4 [Priapulus caudatus]|uniref:Toll-like receptor 4 n=1 Tax=Priapulus caudatus TaxID=37621 RepID=A0ABM1F0M1_PRICU|nr:PREDICTED: toll-like receptor 4 [Priapulus caudatus]